MRAPGRSHMCWHTRARSRDVSSRETNTRFSLRRRNKLSRIGNTAGSSAKNEIEHVVEISPCPPCTVCHVWKAQECKTGGVVRRRQDSRRRTRRLSLASSRPPPPPPPPPQSSPSIRRRNACMLHQPCCRRGCRCLPLVSQPFPSSLHSVSDDILSELFAPVADQARFACGDETRSSLSKIRDSKKLASLAENLTRLFFASLIGLV